MSVSNLPSVLCASIRLDDVGKTTHAGAKEIQKEMVNNSFSLNQHQHGVVFYCVRIVVSDERPYLRNLPKNDYVPRTSYVTVIVC